MTSPTRPRATPSGLTRTSVRSVTTVLLLVAVVFRCREPSRPRRAAGPPHVLIGPSPTKTRGKDRSLQFHRVISATFRPQGLGPEGRTGGVAQVYRELAAAAVDVQLAEVLVAVDRRGVGD